MSEYEGITQELRDAILRTGFYRDVSNNTTVGMLEADFDRLCDAIDSIHANLERENESLRRELDRVTGEMEEHHAWAPESHYMMLPKDAYGEPIHIGDVMQWPEDGDTFEVIGIGEDGVLFYFDPDTEGETADWTASQNKRHYRADTWASIIEDALAMPIHSKADVAQFVARCKALAGDA